MEPVYFGVTPPQYLGPIIAATKDKPVRIVFRNLLPTGSDGDLFLPDDSTLMGAGMGPMAMADPWMRALLWTMVRNPMCSEYPKPDMLLHGQPRHPAPAWRHLPVDLRRHRPPVDHPSRRDYPGLRASPFRTCLT